MIRSSGGEVMRKTIDPQMKLEQVDISEIEFDLRSHEATVLRSAAAAGVDGSFFSIPEPISYPTEAGLTAQMTM